MRTNYVYATTIALAGLLVLLSGPASAADATDPISASPSAEAGTESAQPSTPGSESSSPAAPNESAAPAAPTPTATGTLTTAEPRILGTPSVGRFLSVVTGIWRPGQVVFSYQWQRDGAPIPGANARVYTVAPEDAGATLNVMVTGTKDGYETTSVSSGWVTIPAPKTITGIAPVITGTALPGRLLRVVSGTWDPRGVTLTYQWLRDGIPIDGVTVPHYQVRQGDVGASIAVMVTGSRYGYTSLELTSASVVVAAPPTPAAKPRPTAPAVSENGPATSTLQSTPPRIVGTGVVGRTLRVLSLPWNPRPVTYTHQWLRNGAPIPGATDRSYELSADDAGTTITVSVTGSRNGYASLEVTSASVVVAATPARPAVLFSGRPTLIGTGTVGQDLTLRLGRWRPEPFTLEYQWFRGASPIPQATDPAYTVTADDIARGISVLVSASKPGYATVSKMSDSLMVPRPRTLTTAAPTTTGIPRVGKVLTAVSGTWGPPPVKLAYQWSRNDVPITGATKLRYRLVADDAGTLITVTINGTKHRYVTATLTSEPVSITPPS